MLHPRRPGSRRARLLVVDAAIEQRNAFVPSVERIEALIDHRPTATAEVRNRRLLDAGYTTARNSEQPELSIWFLAIGGSPY